MSGGHQQAPGVAPAAAPRLPPLHHSVLHLCTPVRNGVNLASVICKVSTAHFPLNRRLTQGEWCRLTPAESSGQFCSKGGMDPTPGACGCSRRV